MDMCGRAARTGRCLGALLFVASSAGCTQALEGEAGSKESAAHGDTSRGVAQQDAATVLDAAAGAPALDAGAKAGDGPDAAPQPATRTTHDAGTELRDTTNGAQPGSNDQPRDDDADDASAASANDSRDDTTGEPTPWSPHSPQLPEISAPQRLGTLVGPSAPPEGLVLHGTDLGFPVALDDELLLFFGDTTEKPTDLCEDQGNDDLLASVPLTYEGSVPELRVERKADDASHYQPLQLMHEGQSLSLNAGRVPIGGFQVDGEVYMWFNRLELSRCDPEASDEGCGGSPSFQCVTNIGECAPNRSVVVPPLCDLDKGTGCMVDQRCEPAPSGFCVDPDSSQFDGTVAGSIAAVVHILELGKRRSAEPTIFDRVASFATSKFQNISTLQVAHWTGKRSGNDYGLGEDALLLWGRPGFTGDGAREAQTYLMALPLPLPTTDDGAHTWKPSYFTGVNIKDGQPHWSDEQRDAKPLAMDGLVNGDPHEEVTLVNQMSVAYVGGQVQQWVMLYGGDISNLLIQDGADVRNGPSPGSIVLRVADYPWGPFSAPIAHLTPGQPDQAGSGYGPGGFLHHADCRDTATERCAPPNGTVNLLQCIETAALVDTGRLYGAMILPSYTRDNPGGGVDMFWNVSTWVPYGVVMFKTSLGPVTSEED